MAQIPDPAVDFEGCIDALLEEAKREHDAIPPEERSAYYLAKSLEHLVRMYELDAPRIIIRMAQKRALRNLCRIRRESRQRRANTPRRRRRGDSRASSGGN